LGALGLIVTAPVVTSANGLFLSPSPKVSNQDLSCSVQEKDQFGRCPAPGQSNFRYLSTGSSGGRSGGTSGGK
jgi:hypothetical protein